MDSGIAFLGAGRMAGAMVRGLLRAGKMSPQDLHCTCGEDPSGPQLAAQTGIQYHADSKHLLDHADVLVLACKPQQLRQIDPDIPPRTRGRLVISILAGIPLKTLRNIFPLARNIVRTMPNTPGQIGRGITVYAPLAPLTGNDRLAVTGLLESLGTVLELPETQMDAVTAVSGSGPAYLFEFTAAIEAAACELGLPPDAAALLARHTVTGSAALLEQSSDGPETLRDQVTSPGGTTEAALAALADGQFRSLLNRALQAACDRSHELGS